MTLPPTRGLHIYLSLLEKALDDEIVTGEEAAILDVLADALGLPETAPGAAIAILNEELEDPLTLELRSEFSGRKMGDPSLYQSVLIAALDDDVITDDEWAMLDILRKMLEIQPNEHAMIEEYIRSTALEDGAGCCRVERLAQYLTRHPFG